MELPEYKLPTHPYLFNKYIRLFRDTNIDIRYVVIPGEVKREPVLKFQFYKYFCDKTDTEAEKFSKWNKLEKHQLPAGCDRRNRIILWRSPEGKLYPKKTDDGTAYRTFAEPKRKRN
jgi:hypothetical protein